MAASKDKAASAAEEQFEQGYFGAKVDPTPDENYTVAGAASAPAGNGWQTRIASFKMPGC